MSAELKQNFRQAKNLSRLSPQELIMHLKYEIANSPDTSLRQMCIDLDIPYTYVIAILNQTKDPASISFTRLALIASYFGYELKFSLTATKK